MNTIAYNKIPSVETTPVSNMLFYGLLLFFFFEYVRPGMYFPPLEAARLNTLIPVAVFCFTLLSAGGRSNNEFLNAGNTKWLIFFLCFFPIQIFTADVTLYVYESFKAVIGYFLIYFVIIKQVHNIKRIKSVFIILVFVHILMVVLNPNVILAPEGRHYMGGTFLGDGNDFAWSVCIILPFSLFLAQTSSSRALKSFYFIIFCLLFLVIIGTQSRGGSIAFGTIILYLILKSENKIKALAGIGILVMLVTAFAPQVYFDRMKTIRDYETEESAQGRIMAWKSAYRMAKDHPLVGVGAGHFSVKYGVEYRPPGVGRTELPWSAVHSVYFRTLGEFGFTGFFFILGIILFNFIRNENQLAEIKKTSSNLSNMQRKLLIALQSSLIGFAVGGFFLSGLFYPHMFVLAALLESTYYMIRNSQIIGKESHE